MTIIRRTMLTTVEIEIYRDKDIWEVSLIAYGEWIIERFQNPQECIGYIESYILVTEEEKETIKNLEE
ncbi:MAG: hypothetical protein ACRC40_02415 [Fusobacteriaceae bacterium]